MARILTNDELENNLNQYYTEHFGVREDDFWYPAPAANVRVFARGSTLVTLKCHILTGEVEAYSEELGR